MHIGRADPDVVGGITSSVGLAQLGLDPVLRDEYDTWGW